MITQRKRKERAKFGGKTFEFFLFFCLESSNRLHGEILCQFQATQKILPRQKRDIKVNNIAQKLQNSKKQRKR